jgi:hypothetical protein
MQFSLDTWTTAKVLSVNKRVQYHGDEVVHCQDISWMITVPNTLIDLWFPGLLDAFYRANDTDTLPGIESRKTVLRTSLLKVPYTMKKAEYAGYILSIDHGRGDEHTQRELPGADVNRFKFEPLEGGSTKMFYMTQHVGLAADEMGANDAMDGTEPQIKMLPPVLQEGTLPEASLNPFKRKGKGNGKVIEPMPEAGDIFAGTVGDAIALNDMDIERSELPAKPGKGASFKARAKLALKVAAKKASTKKQLTGQAARP